MAKGSVMAWMGDQGSGRSGWEGGKGGAGEKTRGNEGRCRPEGEGGRMEVQVRTEEEGASGGSAL